MLARIHRLRRDSDIKNAVKLGRCFMTPYIRICVLPTQEGAVRIACVCGKSVSRFAVARHRYQRWLRVLAQKVVTGLDKGVGCDMVWVARPAIAKAHHLNDIEQDLWVKLPAIKEFCLK